MTISEETSHQKLLESYRHKSEMSYDILIVVIGLLISIMSNFTIGLILLTLCLISHYTSARMLLFAKWNHKKESTMYDNITKGLNVLNGAYIIAYILALLVGVL